MRRSTTTSSSASSSLVIRQRISCSTNFSISAASRAPLRDAGMKARTPTSTLRPPLTTAVTVPTIVVLSANAFCSAAQSFGRSTLAESEFVVAFWIATLNRDHQLVASLHGFAGTLER